MREPTINELSNFLEIDAYVISSAYSSMEPIDSLDRIIYKDSKDISLFDTISDNRDYYNIDYLMLSSELEKLTDEEKMIIYLRYFQDKTQSEVAEILGINQVQVSRHEKKTLKKIKENCKIAA